MRAATTPATVLVADDSAFGRTWAERLLTDAGHRVITARDGGEALALARASEPDALVLDEVLPSLTGRQVVRELRQAQSDVGVVMLTGAGDLEADALRSGIDQFVSKPCTADALARAVVVALSAGSTRRDRREHERHNEGEMLAAAAIQAALLPPHPDLPGGWTVDAGFLPSRVVGGDVYDLFPDGPARLVVTVADVSGKGVAGALFGAMFLTAVRAAVSRGDRPGAALASAGALLFGDLVRAGRFLTATVAAIDLDSGAFTYADAGHGHHLLLGPDAAERTLPQGGPPIGFLPDPVYEDGEDLIRSGEVLAIFSDGLVEGGDRDDPVAVRGMLAGLLIAGEPAEALVRDAPDDDDRTMVVVRRAT